MCQNIISGEKLKDTPLLLVLLPVHELSASPAAVNVPYSLVKLHAQEMKVYECCSNIINGKQRLDHTKQ